MKILLFQKSKYILQRDTLKKNKKQRNKINFSYSLKGNEIKK